MVSVTSAAPGAAEQRRGEQVEGLAGALRADDAGGAVPRHPQLAAAAGRAETPSRQPTSCGSADRPARAAGSGQVGPDHGGGPTQPGAAEYLLDLAAVGHSGRRPEQSPSGPDGTSAGAEEGDEQDRDNGVDGEGARQRRRFTRVEAGFRIPDQQAADRGGQGGAVGRPDPAAAVEHRGHSAADGQQQRGSRPARRGPLQPGPPSSPGPRLRARRRRSSPPSVRRPVHGSSCGRNGREQVTPGLGALRSTPRSASHGTGSTGAPSWRTSKCRWTPVLLPVDP